jgi:hypothetical protein
MKRAMPAPVPAAITPFKMILLCEYYISLFVIIKINSFGQFLLQVIKVLKRRLYLVKR